MEHAGRTAAARGRQQFRFQRDERPRRAGRTPARSATETHKQPAYLFALSAKTDDALRRKIVELEAWLSQSGSAVAMEDLSLTLNIGRSHFRRRRAFVAATLVELAVELRRLSESNSSSAVSARAAASTLSEPTQLFTEALSELRTMQSSDAMPPDRYRLLLQAVAEGYVSGLSVDWELVHPRGSGRRISLPTYPFEKRRCWVESRLPARHFDGSSFAR